MWKARYDWSNVNKRSSGLVSLIGILVLITVILVVTSVMVASQPDLHRMHVGSSNLRVSDLVSVSFSLPLLMVWGIFAFQIEKEVCFAFPVFPEPAKVFRLVIHLGVVGVAYHVLLPVAGLVLDHSDAWIYADAFIAVALAILVAVGFGLYRCVRRLVILGAQGSAGTGMPCQEAGLLSGGFQGSESQVIDAFVAAVREACRCPHCGSPVRPGKQQFCGECGRPAGQWPGR